ncbi:hypothetical protein DyAD56_15855 [Dyella sp. AD56]|uniref:DUF2635 domain-containing protein n=1 Tax=Dyella sp. AD56 TaxID=1528744 RepID=UPI000C861A2B|nr:DUF2635 domain-containing protein [Dyella sp. AD56]PMQ04162.1 hypothetical protein DyAD56_15855 [Dyella sp. AD56]
MVVYPAPGLSVRDPVKKDLLPDAGREVSEHDQYWNRRIADGDVVTQPPTAVRTVPGANNGSSDE